MYTGTKRIDVKRQGDVVCANGKVSTNGASLNVYSFYVDGVLIDTGSASLAAEFQSFFKTVDFDQVVLTHYHEDHTGNCRWIEENNPVPQRIHAESIEVCAKRAIYPLYREVVWGRREGFRATPLEKTFQSRTTTWEVIPTPGHSKDHVAFYNRQLGAMFTGDLYVQTKTKLVLREEDIKETMASLQKLLTYDFDQVYCNHAGYLPDGKQRIADKYAYLQEIEHHVKQYKEQGYTAHEITKKMFPNRYPILQFSEGEWSADHIVNAFIK